MTPDWYTVDDGEIPVIQLKAFANDQQAEIAYELRRLVEERMPLSRIVIDLRSLPFLYALLLRSLIGVYRSVTAVGGEIRVCLSPDFCELLTEFHLEEMLGPHSDLDSAINSL